MFSSQGSSHGRDMSPLVTFEALHVSGLESKALCRVGSKLVCQGQQKYVLVMLTRHWPLKPQTET